MTLAYGLTLDPRITRRPDCPFCLWRPTSDAALADHLDDFHGDRRAADHAYLRALTSGLGVNAARAAYNAALVAISPGPGRYRRASSDD